MGEAFGSAEVGTVSISCVMSNVGGQALDSEGKNIDQEKNDNISGSAASVLVISFKLSIAML